MRLASGLAIVREPWSQVRDQCRIPGLGVLRVEATRAASQEKELRCFPDKVAEVGWDCSQHNWRALHFWGLVA